MRKFNKIFQVGMAKTGTLSLCHSLIQLGIPTLHWWSYGDPLPDSVGFDKKGYGIEGLKYLKNNMTFIKEMGYDKLLGTGAPSQAYKITVNTASAKAVEKIEAAGGEVTNG